MSKSVELVKNIEEWIDLNLDCTKMYLISVNVGGEEYHRRIDLDNRHDYMWLIEYMRAAITDFARDNIPVHEDPLELWELCINTDGFGDVLKLYESINRDWVQIWYNED